MLKTISILSIILFLSSLVFTQPPPPTATPKSNGEPSKVSLWSSIKDLPAKQSFVSLDGRFSLAFPQQTQGLLRSRRNSWERRGPECSSHGSFKREKQS
ncbi:MAG: hypothetical protein M3033_08665 [Acidobacteriota bacterium]|nr:hypothetical protein [Acidobacteriota bacterium]